MRKVKLMVHRVKRYLNSDLNKMSKDQLNYLMRLDSL